MDCDRRTFLKSTGLLAAGAMAGAVPFLKSCTASRPDEMPFGIQLWTLRDVFPQQPEQTLRQLAEFGYRQIESFDGPEGIFWGMGNRGMKALMDELGMELVSSHANAFEDFERKAGEAAEIGVKQLIMPWVGPQESLDDYRVIAERFNEAGEIARRAGIRFGYHNHDYTFVEMDGTIPQDLLMEETDPDLVDHQLDMYWVVAAGHDPVEWMRRYPGRFTSGHIKDLTRRNGEMESTLLGEGEIDYPSILEVAKEEGMTKFFVEQEAYTGTTPIDSARDNAAYMRELLRV
ncbi:MAG: sugar phosphate isomerase/epimerase family protein [Balneolaceae bacterium]